jgi:hypothetical protein
MAPERIPLMTNISRECTAAHYSALTLASVMAQTCTKNDGSFNLAGTFNVTIINSIGNDNIVSDFMRLHCLSDGFNHSQTLMSNQPRNIIRAREAAIGMQIRATYASDANANQRIGRRLDGWFWNSCNSDVTYDSMPHKGTHRHV